MSDDQPKSAVVATKSVKPVPKIRSRKRKKSQATNIKGDASSDTFLNSDDQQEVGFGFFSNAPGAPAANLLANEDDLKIVLGTRLNFEEVCVWREYLLEQLTDGVTLDASELTVIDGAGVQCLCAYFKSMRNHGLRVSWRHPSIQLQSAAELMGVREFLNLNQQL